MTSQGIFFHTSLVFHFRGQSCSQKPMSNLSFPRRFAEMIPVNQNSGIMVSFWKFPLQCLFKSGAEFTECSEQPRLFWHWLMNKIKLPQEEILRKACSSVSSRRKRRDKRVWWCATAQTGVFYSRSSGETAWFHVAEQEERERRKTVTRRRENQKKAEERLGLSLPRYSGSWLELTLLPLSWGSG